MSTEARGEFSFRSRAKALERFRNETFDVLIVGGGITGAATARDAASRGLKVALVDRRDFSYGTSSRSSKLIHGGLRYLQNFEFRLVFESLSERAFLLKTAPHMVRPLKFFFPVYQGDPNGKGLLSMGMWLYDLLALFRAPGFHKNLSKKGMLQAFPFLKAEGLQGGFQYYDASMWDDVLSIETLRSANALGAVVASYVEALDPIWQDGRIAGYTLRDCEGGDSFPLRARKVILCGGPWTDALGRKVSPKWNPWLKPSRGVHLIFDAKRLPVPGALVMNNAEDGRISFVIPRPDFGPGVVIVGTTDGPSPEDPAKTVVETSDIDYLMQLLQRYFPKLDLKASDILSAYVGVRPLVGEGASQMIGSEGQDPTSTAAKALQKVSREHHIDLGPGGTVIVAGGKYTTHRTMAQEIVDFLIKSWRSEKDFPSGIGPSTTRTPVNPDATFEALEACREQGRRLGVAVPEALLQRYGKGAVEIARLHRDTQRVTDLQDPEGFPYLEAQLRYAIRNEMVLHLEDFFERRQPLFAARRDGGLPWAVALARVWAQERGLPESAIQPELDRLRTTLAQLGEWRKAYHSQ